MIAGTPTQRGFGSRVIEATIRGQLGGTVRKTWDPGGLICELAVPLRSSPDQ
jgi:two-component sensor histidine kinase